jgi:hypothetical protein
VTAADAWSAAFTSGAHVAQEYDGIMVPRLFDPWADVLLDHVGHPLAHRGSPGDRDRRLRPAPGRTGRVALAAARD